jgi:long-chain acyl-CoA synthetase
MRSTEELLVKRSERILCRDAEEPKSDPDMPGVLPELFRQTCRDRRTRVATIWLPDGQTRTFGDLFDQYELIRGVLSRLGIGPGMPVMSMVGNLPEFLPLLVACMDRGAALLPLGEATDAEAQAIARNAGVAAVVSGRALSLPIAASERVSDRVSAVRLLDDDRHVRRAYPESVVLKLTSGSTELPKTTLTRDSALVTDSRQIAEGMGIGPGDVNFAVIPMSHAYAIGNIAVPLIIQGTAAALRRSFSPSQFVRDVLDSRATVFSGVPFMFDHLRNTLGGEVIPASMRLLISAGARLEPATQRWFHDEAARKIHSFYGTSETGGISYDASEDIPEPMHVGRPLPGVHVEIRVESDQGAGRVFVRNGGQAIGYLGGSDSDAGAAFQDGGFLTGDLGYLDDAGHVVLTGRVSALVNVAGRKVDPAEVERLLLTVPGVAGARVIGVASETRGQELLAFVLRGDSGLTPLSLRQSCADTLSPYKIPRRFIFLEQWPVDRRGKIDRRALEALADLPSARPARD